jgi:hypothetical protein
MAMKQNHYGVNTLVADRDQRRMNDDTKLTVVNTTVKFIQRHFRFIIIDTGNDYTTDAQQALAEMSSNLLIPAYVRRREALDDLPHTLDELSDPQFDNKVERAIVAMSGLDSRRESAKDFGSYVGGRDVANIIGIPYDPVIEYEPSVRLDLLHPDTREAFIDILIGVLEQNVRYQPEVRTNS